MGYRIGEVPPNWVGVSQSIAAFEDPDSTFFPGEEMTRLLSEGWAKVPEEYRARAVVITIYGDATNYMQLGYFKPLES